MSKGDVKSKKVEYFQKLQTFLDTYKTIFIVNVDNVGSNQMHQIRQILRPDSVVLMGKNTMVRKALKGLLAKSPHYEKLLPHVRGNVGFVFTNGDLKTVRENIISNRVAAPAKAGALAPGDVYVPAGNTGMEPGKTSFFQALGIPTKISRGTIEIVNNVHLVKAGERVGASEATLLNMLNISPFTYGMTVTQIFTEGTSFSPSILDIDHSTIVNHVLAGIQRIASLSLITNIPSVAAVPHILINSYKNLLAVSVASEYTFSGSEQIKAFLADPSAFASVVAQSAPAETKAESAPAAEEEEEESDEDMGLDLFG